MSFLQHASFPILNYATAASDKTTIVLTGNQMPAEFFLTQHGNILDSIFIMQAQL